jgi:hypothetical protein
MHYRNVARVLTLVTIVSLLGCSNHSMVAPPSAGGDTSILAPNRGLDTSVPLTGPDHIDTWSYDEYGSTGGSVSTAEIVKYVSYAESGLGNNKAANDCAGGGCKSVFYFDPNHVYDSTGTCTVLNPDPQLIKAASEDWYVHQAGYTDKAHRVYVNFTYQCNGSNVTIPKYSMNGATSAYQAWWRSELQTQADNYDLYLMDDTHALLINQFGQGCPPWPSPCTTTQEVPTNAAVPVNHAALANSLNHTNGQPMQFIFNSMNFNGQPVSVDLPMFSASSRFVMGMCENCAISYGKFYPNEYAPILNTMAAVNNMGGQFLLLSTGGSTDSTDLRITERLTTIGLIWLGYSQGHTIAWEGFPSEKLAVWPEELIYPSEPIQTMKSGAVDLQVAPNVWRREFGACYQAGVYFGRCAVILNASSAAVAVQQNWLTRSYGHMLALSGGDVLDGGVANIVGPLLVYGSTKVPAYSAVILIHLT